MKALWNWANRLSLQWLNIESLCQDRVSERIRRWFCRQWEHYIGADTLGTWDMDPTTPSTTTICVGICERGMNGLAVIKFLRGWIQQVNQFLIDLSWILDRAGLHPPITPGWRAVLHVRVLTSAGIIPSSTTSARTTFLIIIDRLSIVWSVRQTYNLRSLTLKSSLPSPKEE